MRLIERALAAAMVVFVAPWAGAHTVNVDSLNVRSGAGTTYSIVGTLKKGTEVATVSTSGSWTKISSPLTGWVYSTYLTDTPHASSGGTTTTVSGSAFVWPVTAWIGATSVYRWGATHSGSADLYCPYGLPILASRGGTASPYYDPSGSWGVVLNHGSGYETQYGHQIKASFLKSGQVVAAGQVIGYSGRTGQAASPHVHFAIKRYGSRLVIPTIAFGQWVSAARPVPGTYSGLSTFTTSFAPYAVRITDSTLDVRSAADPAAAVVGALAGGDVVTAADSANGWYKIGDGRWIPWTAASPANFDIFGVKVTKYATLRMGPGTGYSASGAMSTGTLATVVDTVNGGSTSLTASWYKVLYGYPAMYRWLSAAYAAVTSEFNTKVSAAEAEVRTGPGASYSVVGKLTIGSGNALVKVYATQNGWYKVLYGGSYRWIAGWKTSGRV